MEFVFAYLAGVLTLINPCVLPVLPIVLATALTADRRAPVMLALGLSLSFVGFGMLVTAFGHAIGLTEARLTRIAALAMILFGAVLLVPRLQAGFEAALAGVSARADAALAGPGPAAGRGAAAGPFLGGLLLGAVWSPCVGPTLGGAIALASQGESLFRAFLIMLAFAAGVSTFILSIGLGGQELIRARARALRGLAARSKTILGILFVAIGVMLLFRLHHAAEAWLLSILPAWLTDLSVTF